MRSLIDPERVYFIPMSGLVARSNNGEISCARLWHEGQRFSVPRIQAGWLADLLGIKLRDGHLGAF